MERRRRAAAHGPEAMREMTAEVARALGRVCTRTGIDRLLAERRLPAVDDPRSLLLLWLAGPYRAVAGHPTWLATDPGRLVAARAGCLAKTAGFALSTMW